MDALIENTKQQSVVNTTALKSGRYHVLGLFERFFASKKVGEILLLSKWRDAYHSSLAYYQQYIQR